MWKDNDDFRLDRAAVLQYIANQQSKDARDDEVKTKWIDQKSVVEGKSVDLGGRRIIKKKKTRKKQTTADNVANDTHPVT